MKGAYPEGSRPDTRRGTPRKIVEVDLPACDPVCGEAGPLFEHWK